jgi:hypothetical protein
MPLAAAGYSGTPLVRKLGVKESHRLLLLCAPEGYVELLEPLPAGVVFESEAHARVDIVQVFVTSQEALARHLRTLRAKLDPNAVVWVSWPKKSAKMATTVTEDTIRQAALPLGFVDVKVCAVSDVWSGLKLVVRKELR